jgi:hypothetical protein
MAGRSLPPCTLYWFEVNESEEQEGNGRQEPHLCHWIISFIVHQWRMERVDEQVVEKIE